MPYRDISDLPKNVRNHLPAGAQKIYMKAFNNAWDEYVKKDPSHEEIAHKVAWSAVKRSYFKDETGKWKKIQ